MKTKRIFFCLSLLTVFCAFSCKNDSKQHSTQSTKIPDNFVKASKFEKGKELGENIKKYKVIPESSKVRWQAKSSDSSYYKGSIKVGQGLVLMDGKHVGAAKMALRMGTLRVENIGADKRRLLQAKILGLMKGKGGWGFSVNDFPFGVVKIIKQTEGNEHKEFTVVLMLKGTLKTIHVPGKISTGQNKNLTIKLGPFSIDRNAWAIAFDNDNLIGRYIQFDMVFKAKPVGRF